MSAMSQCFIQSATLRGVEALPVTVEVSVSAGLPGVSIVGLPDAAVQEARERVKAAIRASGFEMPNEKIVVNLAPSDLRKTGAGFDLPVAVGILVATGQLVREIVENRLFVGELSLDGTVHPVTGILAFGICAHRSGCELVCSKRSDRVPIAELRQIALSRLIDLATGEMEEVCARRIASDAEALDFRDVAGHEVAKRALQIAAAGSHGILMMGPPGSGKTLLASRLPSILPPLGEKEALEAAVVHSVAGEKDVEEILGGRRPFRKPHHSASLPGLVGGGSQPIRPGEISLAHYGVLSEFRTSVLQGIRQPLESGEVCITRADGNVTFPADFMLVAASNPCPCGYSGDREHPCTCTIPQIRKYQARIGGPLMDRIDLHIDVARLPPSSVLETGKGESSAHLREGVMKAREYRSWRCAQMLIDEGARESPKDLVASCLMDEDAEAYLTTMAETHAMSGRAIIRSLSVARTIADMVESKRVRQAHIAEALAFRLREGVGTE